MNVIARGCLFIFIILFIIFIIIIHIIIAISYKPEIVNLILRRDISKKCQSGARLFSRDYFPLREGADAGTVCKLYWFVLAARGGGGVSSYVMMYSGYATTKKKDAYNPPKNVWFLYLGVPSGEVKLCLHFSLEEYHDFVLTSVSY